MVDWLGWSITVATIAWATFGFWAAGHALLYKRDPGAALGWSFVCLFVPYVGPFIYLGFGVNRIGKHAQRLGFEPDVQCLFERPDLRTNVINGSAAKFLSISNRVIHRPIIPGNHIEPLYSGDSTYDAMLDDIKAAEHSVMLATYIFRTDITGRRFVDALQDAKQRGVDVKVLIDGVGALYTWPLPTRILRNAGIPNATFIPLRLFPPSFHLNLRNHRKILVVDGRVGYTGGMNIGDQHVADKRGNTPTTDMHFRLTGQVVKQLEQVFIKDWQFASDDATTTSITATTTPERQLVPAECLSADNWARVITDGPDDDLGKLALVINSAISAAHTSVRIITPYFLPTREMIAALKSASLRGVNVEIVLPEKSNLRFADWATRNLLWEVLKWNVKVYYQPPPFAHTKLFVVDDTYLHAGSANLDPRSLRLNFELAVEIVDEALGASLGNHFKKVVSRSRRVTLEEVDARSTLTRFRDSLAWLFSPYL